MRCPFIGGLIRCRHETQTQDSRRGSPVNHNSATVQIIADGPRHASRLTTVWTLLLSLAWGVWWGGLCFYAVVVVPIGTEEIGAVEQGFITQRVTWWHNLISGAFLV